MRTMQKATAMKLGKIIFSLVTMLGVALLTGCLSPLKQGQVLKVGDPAPALKAGAWIQGEPVMTFANDKVYIVEFWATWCPPCRESIPHLNAIATKFKDKGLVVIGQNVFEKDAGKVKAFIAEMGSNMTYRIALDEKDAMARTWLKAAGETGIPTAFIVDKGGRIAWIGHPMMLDEAMIERVLAGTFDAVKAAAEQKARAAAAELEAETAAAANKAAEEKMAQLAKRMQGLLREKKWDEANAILDEILSNLLETGKDRHRFEAEAFRFFIVLGKDKLDAAADWAVKDCEAREEAPAAFYAWALLGQPRLTDHAAGIARKLALKANETAKGKSALVLQTLARATFMKGDRAQAIELQQQAVALAADAKLKQEFQADLASYKQGQLPAEAVVLEEVLAFKSNAKLNARFREDALRAEQIAERRDKEAAEKGAAISSLFGKVEQAMKAREWEAAEAALNDVSKLDASAKRVATIKHLKILVQKGDVKAALALARQIREGEKDACFLEAIAYELIWTDRPEAEAIALAYEIALDANAGELTGDCRANHRYVLARATFLKGDRAKAVELMQKAAGFVENAGEKKKKVFEFTLERYRVGKLPTINEIEGSTVQ